MIEPRFDSVGDFSEGLARAKTTEGRVSGLSIIKEKP